MTTIGYIFADNKLLPEDRVFLNLAREKNIKVIVFPSARFLNLARVKNLARKCAVVLNNSAERESLEIAKVIESVGTPIVDPTRSLYFYEDKWMFYVHCKKHNIPTPETFLLPISISQCYEPLERLIKKSGAVIIKNIFSDNGKFVDRAKTVKQAVEMIRKFRKGDRAPLIAQEYVKAAHKVYRVMVLNGKVVQAIIKKSNNWKCTGRFTKGDVPTFRVTPKLEKMCVRISKILNIPWCGIDLMRKNREWTAIEANSSPGMDFISGDIENLYKQLLKYLVSISEKWWKL
ncbi:MAG: ATP-grasp domain-containing protein [Patescibacteria group bacterium]